MTTQKQIDANCRNAILSTGPRTDQGKAVSSQNAVKHGLRSSQVLIPGEDHAEFAQFHQAFMDDLSPSGPLQTMLADRIIASFWKLKRAGRMENELFEALMESQSPENAEPAEESQDYILTCTNPDGSTYVGTHYRISDEGVRDMLNEPESDNTNPQDSVKPLRSLGSVVLKDFNSGNILSRFRHYEGQIERSLYKALTELQRQQFLQSRSELIVTGGTP